MKTRVGGLLLVVVTLGTFLPAQAGAQSPFSHEVAIKLPKGANGVQPDLRLVYTPGAGNGIVGVGWQLTGLPFITRVNYGDGIKYAGTDTYAHSLFGVLVKQPDGSYRSKKESFVRFVPSSLCGDGPCSWTAHYPSGEKHYFGGGADSRLLVLPTASVRTWAESSVYDAHGNYYQVFYWNASLSRAPPDERLTGYGIT